MALSIADAAIIAGHLKDHGGAVAGADDTATVALWLRSHWGGAGTDANVIALYAESRADTDLVRWAQDIRLHAGRPGIPAIFLDTDFDSDVDDVVDLAVLLTLLQRGECSVVGIAVSSANTAAAGALYAMLSFYGKTSIPVGQNTSALGTSTSLYDAALVTAYGVAGHVTSTDFESAVDTYRRALATATSPVIILTSGGLETLSSLLQSSGDGISALTGLQLVTAKVSRIYITAGYWPSGSAISDMNSSRVAGDYIFQNCPVPIIMNGIELGDQWTSGGSGVVTSSPLDDPLRMAWVKYFGDESPSNARNGWTQSAIIAAVRGEATYVTRLGDNGQCSVNTSTGATLWSQTPDRDQGYLGFTLPAASWPALINGLLTNATQYTRTNRVTNGTFATNDLTGWDNDSIGTGAASGGTGAAVLTGSNSSNRGRISQAFSCTVGRTYHVILTETGSNYNLAVEIVKNAADGPVTLTNQTAASSAPKVITFVATAATHRLRVETPNAVSTCTFDNIAIYEAL